MGKVSKFKVGDKVESVLNKFEEYEVIEVLRNDLVVSPVGQPACKYKVRKGIFEPLT